MAETTTTPLTDEQLDSVKIEVRWEVREDHRTVVSLREVLQGLDINEDDTFDEDGRCRFASVDEALDWAHREGVRSYWADDWVGNLETSKTEQDAEVDDIRLRLAPETSGRYESGDGRG